jgi:hypothetical protein
MNYPFLLCCLLAGAVFACGNGNDAAGGMLPDEELVVIPGKRVGRITPEMTAAEIEQHYGAENVQKEKIYIAEGETQDGLTLFPGSPQEIEIALNDDGSPQFIRIDQDDSPWKTLSGVSVGTPLDDLREINGGTFVFNGFEWDYGGLVTDWKGGLLSEGLIIALTPGNYEALREDMIGETNLSADDPRLSELGLRVGSMVIVF